MWVVAVVFSICDMFLCVWGSVHTNKYGRIPLPAITSATTQQWGWRRIKNAQKNRQSSVVQRQWRSWEERGGYLCRRPLLANESCWQVRPSHLQMRVYHYHQPANLSQIMSRAENRLVNTQGECSSNGSHSSCCLHTLHHPAYILLFQIHIYPGHTLGEGCFF